MTDVTSITGSQQAEHSHGARAVCALQTSTSPHRKYDGAPLRVKWIANKKTRNGEGFNLLAGY